MCTCRLCEHFIDVFEFQIITLNSDNSLNSETDKWFIQWLAKDLKEFKKFCGFIGKEVENDELRIFLESVLEDIIGHGRRKGYHSSLTYNKQLN